MIRLTLPPKPVQLTAELEQALVAEFIARQKDVWHLEWLKNPLLAMTHEKCAYCERQLGEGVNVTFDHYVYKKHAPDQVMAWGNLLPCCQNCNSNKGTYNVLTEAFFSPIDTPIQTHLEVTAGGMFKGISPEGRAVIGRLQLNHSDQKSPPRFRLIQAITQKLEDCEELYLGQHNSHTITKLRNKIAALLEMTQPKAQYSAVAATVLLHDPRMQEAKNWLGHWGDWTPALEQLFHIASQNALVLRVHRVQPR